MSNRFPTNDVALQRAGWALGQVRARRGYSPPEAADAMGWSVDRLAEIEAGGRNATWLEALDLLTALGASVEDLAVAWSETGEPQHDPIVQRTEDGT